MDLDDFVLLSPDDLEHIRNTRILTALSSTVPTAISSTVLTMMSTDCRNRWFWLGLTDHPHANTIRDRYELAVHHGYRSLGHALLLHKPYDAPVPHHIKDMLLGIRSWHGISVRQATASVLDRCMQHHPDETMAACSPDRMLNDAFATQTGILGDHLEWITHAMDWCERHGSGHSHYDRMARMVWNAAMQGSNPEYWIRACSIIGDTNQT
jgi:hypothetical protein